MTNVHALADSVARLPVEDRLILAIELWRRNPRKNREIVATILRLTAEQVEVTP